jgi:hypothetical protein
MKTQSLRIHTRAGAAMAAVLLLAGVASVGASEPGDDARTLLQHSAQAIGNQSQPGISRWKTRVDRGIMLAHWEGWGDLTADASRYVKLPDKMKLDQDFSAYDHPFFFTYYYNGGEVWAVVNLGVRQHPRYTEQMKAAMRNVDEMAYYLSECDTFFVVPDVPDDSLFTGSAIVRVGIVDNGDTVLVDLDRKTTLPVRRFSDKGATVTVMADYRETGGVWMPFRLDLYQDGVKTTEYTWKSITFDEPIDDAVFEEYRPPVKPASGSY